MVEKNSDWLPLKSTGLLECLLRKKRSYLYKIASHAGSSYRPFDRLQIDSNGEKKWRHIDNPTSELKAIQKAINKGILKKAMLNLPAGILGGIAGKSVKDNAIPHTKQEMVITLDLKDCFPRTSHRKVYSVWKNYFGCGRNNARLLTQLTTFQTRLPQGAPTSLAICNLALLPLFRDIEKYASRHNLTFTLYVDDITISGKAIDALQSITPITKLIQKYGYAVKQKKIRIMPANLKQKVTGFLVNNKLTIEASKIEDIRKLILETGRKKTVSQQEIDSIRGKILHVKNCSPFQGERLERFAEMLLKKPIENIPQNSKEKIRMCKSTEKHKSVYSGKHLSWH